MRHPCRPFVHPVRAATLGSAPVLRRSSEGPPRVQVRASGPHLLSLPTFPDTLSPVLPAFSRLKTGQARRRDRAPCPPGERRLRCRPPRSRRRVRNSGSDRSTAFFSSEERMKFCVKTVQYVLTYRLKTMLLRANVHISRLFECANVLPYCAAPLRAIDPTATRVTA